MKKLLLISFLMCLFASFSLADTPAQQPTKGDGSKGNPFQISNLAELRWLSENESEWTKYYIQTADIDAAETTTWNDGAGFSPIGKGYSASFKGIYNGNKFKIINLYINRPDDNYQALFGYTYHLSGRKAEIKGLILEDVNIKAKDYAGGIIGYGEYTDISQCGSTGSIVAKNYIGGIAGFLNDAKPWECYSHISIQGVNYVAGIVGYSLEPVVNCYSRGQINGIHAVGGIAGLCAESSNSLYFAGTISGNTATNPLVGGVVYPVTQDNFKSFWDTQTTQITSSVYGEGKSTAEMQNYITYLLYNWSFKDTKSPQSPAIWNIGNDAFPFQGSYDGLYHKIKGLKINRPEAIYQGLFGVARHAVIKRLKLDYSTNIKGKKWIGGVVGNAEHSTIEQCWIEGKVESVNDYAGGITGNNANVKMYECVSSGTVTGGTNGGYIGGLTGRSEASSIENSFSKAQIQGRYSLAGLAGSAANSDSILNCYFSGSLAIVTPRDGIAASGSPTVLDTFWDINSSSTTFGAGSATGITQSDFKNKQIFTDAGWNFSTVDEEGIWSMDEQSQVINDGNPYLTWMYKNPIELDLDDVRNPSSQEGIIHY